MICKMDLLSLLLRGTSTWQSDLNEHQFTINLVLASESLPGTVYWCTTEGPEHDSDHRAIRTAFAINWTACKTKQRRL
jgi:hypothetical protein